MRELLRNSSNHADHLDIRFLRCDTASRGLRIGYGALNCRFPTTMASYNTSDDNQPVMWLRGHAVYTAHCIVLAYVGSLLVTTVFMALKAPFLFTWLPFEGGAVLRGEIWRLLSYGLVNPPSLGFVIDMVMIVWFGREVEKSIGRRQFLLLYGCLYLITPLLFTVIGVWLPLRIQGATGAFALFVTFATLYPETMMLFNILAKWVALILVSLYTLMALADRNLPALISLWATTGFAFAYVRFEQSHITLPDFRFWRRKPKFRVLPDLPSLKSVTKPKPINSTMAEMDELLDKIARSGLASLTTKERAKLEQSRTELLKKSGPDRS